MALQRVSGEPFGLRPPLSARPALRTDRSAGRDRWSTTGLRERSVLPKKGEWEMTKILVSLLASLVVFGLTVPFAAHAAEIIKAGLVACPHDGTVLGGVNSCGKIWKLKSGEAQLGSDGTLKVEVKNLVLNDSTVPPDVNGTADGVSQVAASLVCTGGGSARVAAQTDLVPLSKSGDAKIQATLTLPKTCIAPIVIIREFYDGKIGGWLAATGF